MLILETFGKIKFIFRYKIDASKLATAKSLLRRFRPTNCPNFHNYSIRAEFIATSHRKTHTANAVAIENVNGYELSEPPLTHVSEHLSLLRVA